MLSKPQAESFTLLESLDRPRIKLLYAAVREVGPAAETLGAILHETNSSTFKAQKKLASEHSIAYRTFKRHVAKLHETEWIIHGGRSKASNSHARRTNTIYLTDKAKESACSYGVLPSWAVNSLPELTRHPFRRRNGRLKWAERVVMSMVLSQLVKLTVVIDRQGIAFDESLLDYLGTDHWFCSLRAVARRTGLSPTSIWEARDSLTSLGIVHRQVDPDDNQSILLRPNLDFAINQSPYQPREFHESTAQLARSLAQPVARGASDLAHHDTPVEHLTAFG